MPAQTVSATADVWLEAWIAPVDALVARRGGRDGRDPLLELQEAGYLPEGHEPGAWEHLDAGGWLALLQATGRRCPRLATALVAARLTMEIAGAPLAPDAIAKRAAYMHAHLAEAGAPLLRVASALLATQSSESRAGSACAAEAADTGVAVPTATLRRVPGELLAVASGALWRLWNAAAEHAEARPMFRRVLADFPVVRLRLLRALAAVLEAEEHARRAAVHPDDGAARAAFHDACLRVRTDTQQLCGGSGYMRESAYAEPLQALDQCLRILGLLPDGAAGARAAAAPGARARLSAWGITDAQWAALSPGTQRRRPGR